MAKTPAEVMSFLEDLETKLRPLGLKEREELLELKRAEHEKRGLPADERFNLWDYRYYDRLFVEKTLDLGASRAAVLCIKVLRISIIRTLMLLPRPSARTDDNLVKEYFPVAKVVPTVLDIYKDLLGIELVAVPREEAHGGITWHDECELYAVWENGQAQSGNQDAFLGYMFLDLQPRENKYGHAAVWGLIPGWTDPNKGRQFPTVCMVANLAKPTPGRPATMKVRSELERTRDGTAALTFFGFSLSRLGGIRGSMTTLSRSSTSLVTLSMVSAPRPSTLGSMGLPCPVTL